MSIFCSVKAGINCCEICTKNAYYIIKRKDAKATGLPVMELFRCGHGMCELCYTSMVDSQGGFKCPFCRDKGRVYKSSVNDLESDHRNVKESHTFRQYVAEFNHNPELLKYSQHVFMRLHKYIVGIWKMEQRASRDAHIKSTRLNIVQEKAAEKARSRERAVCKVCKRDTFTSEIQLWIHIKAHHPRSIISYS
jgi:hypothetical protein